jgi:hypothetical protein
VWASIDAAAIAYGRMGISAATASGAFMGFVSSDFGRFRKPRGRGGYVVRAITR